ncbi:hypothetical protein ACS0PU_003775 [Formica fusca]
MPLLAPDPTFVSRSYLVRTAAIAISRYKPRPPARPTAGMSQVQFSGNRETPAISPGFTARARFPSPLTDDVDDLRVPNPSYESMSATIGSHSREILRYICFSS